ncbi:2-phosphosulfolactate phosphatase [Nocardia sp. NPDC052566]|uniref:2-phosphosulfolactate phosphatase n=1 Tax=Nocardia sp. NPDC052566 TaxID=3364330 RepID=UPI0037C66C24
MNAGIFRQEHYRVRLEWGREGVEQLAGECGVLIVVDVLSFSTSVDIAVGRGGRVLPIPLRHNDPRAAIEAERAGAVLAAAKYEPGWSLSPSSLLELPANTLLALPSPNGATLSARAAEFDTRVIAGSLRNASAVAEAAVDLAGDLPIGVIAAGERWGVVEGPLRPSIEDYLGAGAIAAALLDHRDGGSPEARLAATAFRAAGRELPRLVAEAISGQELADAGLAADVRLAAELDASIAVPVLVDGIYSGVG